MTLHLLPPSPFVLCLPSVAFIRSDTFLCRFLISFRTWNRSMHFVSACVCARGKFSCLYVGFAVYDSTCVSTASAYSKYAHFLHNYKSDAFADFVLRLQFSAAAYAEPCELCIEKEFLFRASLIALCLITRQWRVEIFSLAELFLLPR